MKSLWLALLLVLSAAILDAADEKSGNAPVISEIRAVLRAQQEAWNRGDIDSFMNGYARAETTVFVSGDEVMRGWRNGSRSLSQEIQRSRQDGHSYVCGS